MSDIPDDWRGQLDIRKEIIRIDRDRAETQKLAAEARKFDSERMKLDRDRWLAPLVLAASLLGGLLVAVISHIWR